MTRFKLLALDIDGTLIGPDARVSEANRRAVSAARAAGLAVCLATGRSYPESRSVWEQLHLPAPHEPMVTVGGAMVCQSDTGRTLYHRSIQREVARRFGSAMNDRGYVAMALVDGWRNGTDYLITERGDHHAASRDWFSKMNVRVRQVPSLGEAGLEMAMLRISTVVDTAEAGQMAAELSRQFDGQLNVHAILAPNYGITIVEAHAVGADKMTALRYIGQPLLIGAGQLAAVGDDLNDLSMVRGAGVGAAMGHSPKALQAVADIVVGMGAGEPGAGLAEFIGQLVAGEYDGLARADG